MKVENRLDLVAPTININGENPVMLLKLHHAALLALQEAALALTPIFPHGRDFQTAEPGELETAIDQHGRWMRAISVIALELSEVASCLQSQIDDRRRPCRG